MFATTSYAPRCSLIALAYLLLGTFLAGDGAAQDADRDAIRSAARQYVTALQRGDAEVLRSMWSPDGDYIDAAGNLTKAKNMFQNKGESRTIDSPTSEVRGWESSLRFITPEVAIEDGAIESEAGSDGSALLRRFSVVWVKRDGKWLIDSLREASSTTPSISDRLSPLAWLVGEWAAKTDHAEIIVSTRWSDRGIYLLRDFVIRGKGRESLSGTERIGWDPIEGKIKSWTFDSQGGAGEGFWRQDGNRWIVDAVEVMPDGKKAETSVAYTPKSAFRFEWEVVTGKIAEESLPKQRLEFVRADEQ